MRNHEGDSLVKRRGRSAAAAAAAAAPLFILLLRRAAEYRRHRPIGEATDVKVRGWKMKQDVLIHVETSERKRERKGPVR